MMENKPMNLYSDWGGSYQLLPQHILPTHSDDIFDVNNTKIAIP